MGSYYSSAIYYVTLVKTVKHSETLVHRLFKKKGVILVNIHNICKRTGLVSQSVRASTVVLMCIVNTKSYSSPDVLMVKTKPWSQRLYFFFSWQIKYVKYEGSSCSQNTVSNTVSSSFISNHWDITYLSLKGEATKCFWIFRCPRVKAW